MSGFSTHTFSKHDDYMTPKSAWEAIKDYIPDNTNIWDPFYGDGASKEFLQEIKPTCNVHSEDDDFFTPMYDYHNSIIVTNPPFSKIKAIIKRLKEMETPFIMIMPSSKICTQYFRQTFAKDTDPIQLIIPRKRIQFEKKLWCDECLEYHSDPLAKKCCNFDCFYYCWKMGLPRDIVWLD